MHIVTTPQPGVGVRRGDHGPFTKVLKVLTEADTRNHSFGTPPLQDVVAGDLRGSAIVGR